MLPDGPRLIQEVLGKRGYLPNHRSGSLDGPTRTALQRFQADHGLPSTGAPDRETLRKLGLDPGKVFVGPSG
jgi:peptidoglycan hydrolase-like protein with peptidoglycan-binding domain